MAQAGVESDKGDYGCCVCPDPRLERGSNCSQWHGCEQAAWESGCPVPVPRHDPPVLAPTVPPYRHMVAARHTRRGEMHRPSQPEQQTDAGQPHAVAGWMRLDVGSCDAHSILAAAAAAACSDWNDEMRPGLGEWLGAAARRLQEWPRQRGSWHQQQQPAGVAAGSAPVQNGVEPQDLPLWPQRAAPDDAIEGDGGYQCGRSAADADGNEAEERHAAGGQQGEADTGHEEEHVTACDDGHGGEEGRREPELRTVKPVRECECDRPERKDVGQRPAGVKGHMELEAAEEEEARLRGRAEGTPHCEREPAEAQP